MAPLAQLTGQQVVLGSPTRAPALRRTDQLFVSVGADGGTFPVQVLTSSIGVCIG